MIFTATFARQLELNIPIFATFKEMLSCGLNHLIPEPDSQYGTNDGSQPFGSNLLKINFIGYNWLLLGNIMSMCLIVSHTVRVSKVMYIK